MYEGNLKHSFTSLVGIFKIQILVMGRKCLDIANKFPKKENLLKYEVFRIFYGANSFFNS